MYNMYIHSKHKETAKVDMYKEYQYLPVAIKITTNFGISYWQSKGV